MRTVSPMLHLFSSSCAMNFFVHLLRSLYLGNIFHRATETKTDLTILLDTTVPTNVFMLEQNPTAKQSIL